MPTYEDNFSLAATAAMVAVAHIPDSLADVQGLDDSALLTSQRELSELRRIVDARSSLVAGEIAHRSRRELGYTGMAQKLGFQSAEKLVQATTGSTRRDASTLVTAGTMVHEAMVQESLLAEGVDPGTGELAEGVLLGEPWLAAVGVQLAAGLISVDAARAIRSGLGEPTSSEPTSGELSGAEFSGTELPGINAVVTSASLAAAVEELLLAKDLNADELYRRARAMRDQLDEAGIAQREQLLYSQRSFRRSMRANGLPRYTIDPDLEMSVWLDDVYDKLTSPRRGGPRFVDPGDREWSAAIAEDTRSTEQYLHDAVLGLLHKGVDADLAEARAAELVASQDPAKLGKPTRRRPRIVGSRLPAVRVLVTEESLRSRIGHGRFEGSDIPVSIETVERHVCNSGSIAVGLGAQGNVIDLGRESRLFTAQQKLALAVRDGGCMFENCDRRSSWTEAHHINHWARDGGRTDVADGILLCRHHHMLVHNNHWEIVREGAEYWLIPPPDIDRAQQRRRLRSKSAILNDFQHQHQHQQQPQQQTGQAGQHDQHHRTNEPVQRLARV